MRSLEQIIEEQETVLQKYPTLTGLDSTSDVSFFAQMRKMWALLVQITESEWDSFRTGIELKIANTKIGSITWYVEQIKAFQFGDSLSVVDGKAVYDVLDAEKRIVVQATVTEDISTGRLGVRAAKKGESGLTVLTSDELDALKAYVSKIKYAGVVADVTSLEADHLKLTATVKVDRQVINTSGALLSDPTRFPVIEKIAEYLRAIPADSVLSNTALTDAIQSVKGVKDFTINGSATRRPVAVTWIVYNRETVSIAGHGELHNDSQITYTY